MKSSPDIVKIAYTRKNDCFNFSVQDDNFPLFIYSIQFIASLANYLAVEGTEFIHIVRKTTLPRGRIKNIREMMFQGINQDVQ